MTSRAALALLAALSAAGCLEDQNLTDADGDGWVASADCNDADAAVHVWVTGYADADRDHVGAGASSRFCTAGGLPGGYVFTGTDCAALDPTAWRAVERHADRDGDGHTAREDGTLCVGATLPEPYRDAAAGNDCDDTDPALFRWVMLYRDGDGDGVGAGRRSIPCLGDALPAETSRVGWDADDADPAVVRAAEDAFDVLD